MGRDGAAVQDVRISDERLLLCWMASLYSEKSIIMHER